MFNHFSFREITCHSFECTRKACVLKTVDPLGNVYIVKNCQPMWNNVETNAALSHQ